MRHDKRLRLGNVKEPLCVEMVLVRRVWLPPCHDFRPYERLRRLAEKFAKHECIHVLARVSQDEEHVARIKFIHEAIHHGGRHLDALAVKRAALELGRSHRGVRERRAGSYEKNREHVDVASSVSIEKIVY